MSTRFAWVLSLAVVAMAARPASVVAGPTVPDNVQSYDLAKLADGESKVFGEGEKAVTATRKGEVVTMVFNHKGGEDKPVQCTIGRDSCYVMTSDKSGAGNLLYMGKEGEAGGHGMITAVVAGDGPEGLAGGDEEVIVSKGEGDKHVVRVMRIKESDGKLLRCPEGDVTMTLKKDETNSGYRCPKHNLALEEVKGEPHRVVRIERRIENK